MKKVRSIQALVLSFLLTASLVEASEKNVIISKKDRRNGLNYSVTVSGKVDDQSPFYKRYKAVQRHINLLVEFPGATIEHKAFDEQGRIEFQKQYSTTEFGFRKTPEKKGSQDILIVAGDSNVFGIGCNDNETLTYYLDKLLPKTQVYNLGMAGTAGNGLLFFMDHFQLNELSPRLDGNTKTLMVFNFSEYLMERMIGGKNFIKWGWMQPSYELVGNELVFSGFYNDKWMTRIYKIINLIDPKNYLIPNLPQYNEYHYKLIAKIFESIQKKYHEQTNFRNRFAVLIDPFSLNPTNRPIVRKVEVELNKLGIQTIRVNEEKALKQIDIYKNDLHLKPVGQKFYAGLIVEKLSHHHDL